MTYTSCVEWGVKLYSTQLRSLYNLWFNLSSAVQRKNNHWPWSRLVCAGTVPCWCN